MKTDKKLIEILSRAFFHAFFTKAAGSVITDVSNLQPITIKILMIKELENLSYEFNTKMIHAIAAANGLKLSNRKLNPETFEEATKTIKKILNKDDELYNYYVERYKYHFTLALSGSVEKADIINDTDILNLIKLVQ